MANALALTTVVWTRGPEFYLVELHISLTGHLELELLSIFEKLNMIEDLYTPATVPAGGIKLLDWLSLLEMSRS